jgi:uncharacterized secreted protein with C-terminal beta-propeller domain
MIVLTFTHFVNYTHIVSERQRRRERRRSTMMNRVRTITIGMLGAVLLTACGGGSGGSDAPAPRTENASLSQVADCEELADFVRADARDKLAVQAAQLRSQGWGWADVHPAPAFTASPAPQATAAAGPEAPARHFTDTNLQVPGIDEPDMIETDGDRLYLLDEASLLVVDAFPPADTALRETIAVEGQPTGMFVTGDRALVFSRVYDSGDLGGADACGIIGGPFPLPVFAGGVLPQPGLVPDARCPAAFVKLTLLDLAATPARTVRELYLEGDYLSARRQDGVVRLVAQRWWGLPASIPDPWRALWVPTPPADATEFAGRVDAWEQSALAAVDASPLDAWLPAVRERRGGALIDLPLPCEQARVPSGTTAPQGSTVVLALDMSVDDSAVANTLLLGGASQLYANGETLVLASSDWQPVATDDAAERTILHVFALPAASLATEYRGSGTVAGFLPSTFALDARNDVLRVATTVTNRESFTTASRITTVRLASDGTLTTLGTTPDLAPGERLFGTRFLGDRAYLVTFRQVDPLFVVDLADAAHPAVLGEVELPGFSEYLHPLGDRHLLTVGQAAGLFAPAVRIFDVGDPSHPRLTSEYTLPEGWTPATGNHLAFVYDPTLGILALPFSGYARSSLFLLDVDASTGITLRGEVREDRHVVPCPPGFGNCFAPCAPPFDWEGCPVPCDGCFEDPQMERGLFIDDAVYAISTRHVQVFAVDDLSAPRATATLP